MTLNDGVWTGSGGNTTDTTRDQVKDAGMRFGGFII